MIQLCRDMALLPEIIGGREAFLRDVNCRTDRCPISVPSGMALLAAGGCRSPLRSPLALR
jgi:hypothetical protein